MGSESSGADEGGDQPRKGMGWREFLLRLFSAGVIGVLACVFAPSEHEPGLALGLVLTLLLGGYVGLLLKFAHGNVEDPNIPGWEKATQLRPRSAKLVGFFEQLMFFAALWLEVPLAIGGWLGFKVASKWEVWKDVIQVPSTDFPVKSSLDALHARHVWGTKLLGRFILGPLANIVFAGVGVLVARALEGRNSPPAYETVTWVLIVLSTVGLFGYTLWTEYPRVRGSWTNNGQTPSENTRQHPEKDRNRPLRQSESGER